MEVRFYSSYCYGYRNQLLDIKPKKELFVLMEVVIHDELGGVIKSLF